MTTRKKICNTIIIFSAIVFIALAAISFACALPASAESTGTISLEPIATDNADVKYYCFDEPESVFADGAGIAVVGKNGIYDISGETEITAERSTPANKLYRSLAHGERSEYEIILCDGKITLYAGDAFDELKTDGSVVTNAVDFAVYNDVLYAVTRTQLIVASVNDGAFETDATASTLHCPRYNNIEAFAVAVVDGTTYIAVDSAFGSRCDICIASNDGELNVALMQSETVLSMTAASSVLYTLTRSETVAYSVAASGGLIKRNVADGSAFTDIYAYGGHVYALDSLNALHKLSSDLTEDKTLFASSSDVKGYFNTPNGIAVKNSVIYVADTLNDRIAMYGSGITYVTREFANPVSVGRDSAGTAYVAYEYNKIGIFDGGDFSRENERTLFEPQFGYIIQIAVSADKTLFVLSSTGVWRVENGQNTPELLDSTHYKAIALGVGKEKLYALSDDGVYRLDGDSPEKICDAPAHSVSLAIDLAGSVFILTQNSVVSVKDSAVSEYSLACGDEGYSLGGGLGQIALCSVSNEYATHGDVLIVDGYKHRIFKTSGAALGIKLVDESYVVPDIANDNEPAFYGTGLIRTAIRNTEVFARPMEGAPVYTITRGRNVIVPQYVVEEAQEYSLVLIDDTVNGKLVQGYVFRDALSAPLPYSPPPAATGTVFNAATPIYKFPSRHSKPVRGFSAVDGNTEFAMLEFVESFRDDYGNLWYRLSLDGTNEGYVLAVNISTGNYDPVFIRPSYNAEIISYKGSEYAVGYESKDGKYVELTKLPTGTQVEVVGSFDSSEKYTEVKFVDSHGTITCFVETAYINYNGINIVLLVAIIVIMITVILASIIVARVMRNKRKNLVDDKMPEED